MTVQYRHPVVDSDGNRLSTANIIWAERDRGSAYYRVSRYAMRYGKFPPDHPCSPGAAYSNHRAEMASSESLTKFRSRGYWASCFPEGDGITLSWWENVPEPPEKTAEQVMSDIRECFGWDVVQEPPPLVHDGTEPF